MGAAEPGRGPKSRNSGGTMGLEDTDFFFEFRPPNGKNNLTGFSGKWRILEEKVLGQNDLLTSLPSQPRIQRRARRENQGWLTSEASLCFRCTTNCYKIPKWWAEGIINRWKESRLLFPWLRCWANFKRSLCWLPVSSGTGNGRRTAHCIREKDPVVTADQWCLAIFHFWRQSNTVWMIP